jgi:hypothetical protein
MKFKYKMNGAFAIYRTTKVLKKVLKNVVGLQLVTIALLYFSKTGTVATYFHRVEYLPCKEPTLKM